VRQSAETAIREVVGKSKMDFVLYEGREQVAANATKLIQDILDRLQVRYRYQQADHAKMHSLRAGQAAFDDAVKAGQDPRAAKEEGQAYANDVCPRAR